MTHSKIHPDTLVAVADRDIDADSDIAPPIHQTATFAAGSDAQFAEMANTPRHPRNYTRDGNPTTRRAESIIAALEGAEAALLTASGMGAISTTLLTLLGSGDAVAALARRHGALTVCDSTIASPVAPERAWPNQTSHFESVRDSSSRSKVS